MHTSMRILAALAAVAGLAVAANTQSINAKCPIKGTPVNPSITVEYKGKTIGFC